MADAELRVAIALPMAVAMALPEVCVAVLTLAEGPGAGAGTATALGAGTITFCGNQSRRRRGYVSRAGWRLAGGLQCCLWLTDLMRRGANKLLLPPAHPP